MIGVGVLIQQLGGVGEPLSNYVGQQIVEAKFENNALFLRFESGKKIKISDEGQSCCENRYARTDDDVTELVGQNLVSIEERGMDDFVPADANRDHEQRCVIVQGDKSSVTVVTHNEHNGYYGGFYLCIQEVT